VSAAHAHDHDHHHAHSASPARLRIALVCTALVALVELAGGFRSGSLALISDAAHVTMDVVALVVALAASVNALRAANVRQTFGFARLEVLGALANGGLLLGVTVAIVIEAIKRFAHPVEPQGGLMAGVAAFGLVVNVGVGVMLARDARSNLNVRAAFLHVAGDALGAVAVIVGAGLIVMTHQAWIDPLLSLLVSVAIIAGVVTVFRQTSHVLLESVPDHISIATVREHLRRFEGVVDVHDLHVWTLGSGSHVLSAHVVLNDRRISEATAILREIDEAMRAEFDIGHVTVQFECETCEADERIVCTQVAVPQDH
jgi:cobalt-zinc-cadmium efflux system protein